MKKLAKAIAAIMLTVAVICSAGCKPDDNNGGGGGSGNNDGGGHYNGNYEYVDLGLPSGTLWATFNLGAATPEERGDLFAWGETEPNAGLGKENYKYGNGRWHEFRLTKYCSDPRYGENGYTDTLTVLQPEDDAATVNWGDGWCMPTVAQYRELIDNTTRTYQYGTKGVLLTASNGNSIFFPAWSWRFNDNGRTFSIDGGLHWTNEKSADPYDANGFDFMYSIVDDGIVQNIVNSNLAFVNELGDRYEGWPVRPVRSSN